MINISDLSHLPCTRGPSGGAAPDALRSLPYAYSHAGGSPYDRLQRILASAVVELAFRRHLAEQEVPFEVKAANPFTEPGQNDAALGGRIRDIRSFLVSRREQTAEMKRNPGIVLNAPALVPSDQNAAEGNSHEDASLFALLSGVVAATIEDIPQETTCSFDLRDAGKVDETIRVEAAREVGAEVGISAGAGCRG